MAPSASQQKTHPSKMHSLAKHAKKSMSGLRERFHPQVSEAAGQPNITAPPAAEKTSHAAAGENANAPATQQKNAMRRPASSVYSRNTAGEVISPVERWERPEWAPEWFPDFHLPPGAGEVGEDLEGTTMAEDDAASVRSDRTVRQEDVTPEASGRSEGQRVQIVESEVAPPRRRARAMTMLPGLVSSGHEAGENFDAAERQPARRDEVSGKKWGSRLRGWSGISRNDTANGEPVERRSPREEAPTGGRFGRLRALTSASQIFRRRASSTQNPIPQKPSSWFEEVEIPHSEEGEFCMETYKSASRACAERAGRMYDLMERRISINYWKAFSEAAKGGPMVKRVDSGAPKSTFVAGEGAVLETSSGRRLPLKYQNDPRGVTGRSSGE